MVAPAPIDTPSMTLRRLDARSPAAAASRWADGVPTCMPLAGNACVVAIARAAAMPPGSRLGSFPRHQEQRTRRGRGSPGRSLSCGRMVLPGR